MMRTTVNKRNNDHEKAIEVITEKTREKAFIRMVIKHKKQNLNTKKMISIPIKCLLFYGIDPFSSTKNHKQKKQQNKTKKNFLEKKRF